MSICCTCCSDKTGCKHQWVYFIVAVILWAYAFAALLIPADFPLGIGDIKEVLFEPSLAVLAFNFVFVAANIIIGALVNAKYNAILKSCPEDYLATKLRNAFVACFGFVASLRLIVLLVWVLGYTA